MKTKELCDKLGWELAFGCGDNEISCGIYCGDLLSIVMSRAPAGCLWVTIMGNVNAMAVASLTECACVVLAEGVSMDDETRAGAEKGDITVLRTDMPIFEASLAAARALGLA